MSWPLPTNEEEDVEVEEKEEDELIEYELLLRMLICLGCLK